MQKDDQNWAVYQKSIPQFLLTHALRRGVVPAAAGADQGGRAEQRGARGRALVQVDAALRPRHGPPAQQLRRGLARTRGRRGVAERQPREVPGAARAVDQRVAPHLVAAVTLVPAHA